MNGIGRTSVGWPGLPDEEHLNYARTKDRGINGGINRGRIKIGL